jgi:hypothetical protein
MQQLDDVAVDGLLVELVIVEMQQLVNDVDGLLVLVKLVDLSVVLLFVPPYQLLAEDNI